MSTERITASRSENVTVSGPPEVYETRDFYLACYLRCLGYALQELRAEGRRKVFVFEDKPGREADVLSFFGDRTTVPPLAFSSTIKDMKALLHNA